MTTLARMLGIALCFALAFMPHARGQTPTSPPPHNQFQYPVLMFEGPITVIVTASPRPISYDLDVFVSAMYQGMDTTSITLKAGSRTLATCANAIQCAYLWPYAGAALNTSISVAVTFKSGTKVINYTVVGNVRRANKLVSAELPPPTQTAACPGYLLDTVGGRILDGAGGFLTC